MNPDTLRGLADEVDAEMVFRYEYQRRMRLHAAAWAADRKRLEAAEEELRLTTEIETKLNDECVELRKRLEALKRLVERDWADLAEDEIDMAIDEEIAAEATTGTALAAGKEEPYVIWERENGE